MFEVRDLTVRYGPVAAVDGISVRILPRQIVAILGSNGAGKTSTLMGISAVVPGRTGELWFEGKDVSQLRASRVFRLGIVQVPEGRRVFAGMTVAENLVTGANGTSQRGRSERLEYVYDVFPKLVERRRQLAGSLSGGEQQMLAIGRALVSRPKLLMLDEPSLGLAPNIVTEMFATIDRLRSDGLSILLVEQNAGEALAIADYAYVLANGSLTIEGPSQEVAVDASVARAYLGL